MKGFELLFQTASSSVNTFNDKEKMILTKATNIITSVVNYCEKIYDLNMSGKLSEEDARTLVIGQGHHRIVCYKQ